jgi:hypothetical protein
MLDKLLHHKLLTSGLEGQGVITGRSLEGRMEGSGFLIGIDGHIKFDDGSEVDFSSSALNTAKVGDLDIGTIVPVRYDSDHKHAVLDIPKLEAAVSGEWDADERSAAQANAERVAAADAQLANRSESAPN